jgi:hypothetical protein
MGEEVKGGYGKLHSEQLHNLYSLPNIRVIGQGGRDRWDIKHAWGDEKFIYIFV